MSKGKNNPLKYLLGDTLIGLDKLIETLVKLTSKKRTKLFQYKKNKVKTKKRTQKVLIKNI